MSERGATTITVVIVDVVVMTPGYHLSSLIYFTNTVPILKLFFLLKL